MPKIPKMPKMPFKKNYVYPEGGMYELRRKLPPWTLDARRGYHVGYYPDDAEITPIQGPMLPARVEARRQAYLDALEDYREVMNEMAMEQAYNRKAMAWNDYIGHSPTMRRAISSGKFDEWNRYFNEPDYPRRPEFGEEIKSFEDFPDEWSHIPWREWK